MLVRVVRYLCLRAKLFLSTAYGGVQYLSGRNIQRKDERHKKARTLKTCGLFGGEDRARTDDLLHAMQAL